ncbi:MAG: DEAD/DEAH box helicase [Methylocystaceae bacterium]
MNTDFNSLGIVPPILKALDEMGFEAPTEVQVQAIPQVLKQEDVIVISKTGSGKTAVFGVPLLQLIDPGTPGPQGLILTPTRELAVQVDSDLKRMAQHLPHRTTCVYGQHSMNTEVQALSKDIAIVTGTPGRVYDHIYHGNLKTRNIRFLVLDEADRMLDMGFLDQVVRIVRTLPRNRVSLLFSATIPPEVRRICQSYMKNPVTIEIESHTKTVDTTEQIYYRVEYNQKNTGLNRLLLLEQPKSCVVFCNQRVTVDKVRSFLDRKGYAVQALHGDIPQVKRMKTIDQFKQGDFHILIATDVAARGIHIDDLSLVINYDIPLEKDGYIHRIGRTGRAGNIGRAVSLVTGDDIMSLYEIEEHIGVLIEEAEFPSEPASDEQKASLDQWLQSNTQKRKRLLAAAGSNGTGNQQKRTQSRPPQQQQNKQGPHPGNKNRNTNKVIKPATPTPRADQSKAPVTVRTEMPRPVEPKVATPPTNPKQQTAADKKTFFQRIISRIAGR